MVLLQFFPIFKSNLPPEDGVMVNIDATKIPVDFKNLICFALVCCRRSQTIPCFEDTEIVNFKGEGPV